LRKTAVALALVLVATLGIAVPSVAAAVGDPKVVIIVGATHGTTSSYRTKADRAYAEAIKYTSNVVKVYSPYATWSKVKAAVVGASVVIYFGHGNGWPSAYTYDPNYTTKDGFGLNAAYNEGDYNNKYYGEPYVSTMAMAPGAIVLLHHLCYASGNSEPGQAEPTVSVARQRADNYAAGFLKAGAAAVIADGHAGAEGYLRALFTTHQSIEEMWRGQPNAHGNFVSFPSVRTPGATVFQDPDTATSGYYRSAAIRTVGITTGEVVSAGYGDTGTDPLNLVVPGNAEVSTDGASLYGDTIAGEPVATVPAGTRLHVVASTAQTTPEGAPLVEVEGLDDPGIAGFMQTADLVARDSTKPVVRVLDVGVGRFSPNGDGQGDQALLRARFTETVDWTLRVRNAGNDVLFERTGTGSTVEVAWDGIVAGDAVADGTYSVGLTGIDDWGNGPAVATRALTVDTVAPALTSLTPGATTKQWFSPNGDGSRDAVSLTATSPESGNLVSRVLNGDGALVRTWTAPNGTAPVAVTWNGRNTAGAYVPDGAYTLSVAPVDLAGNTGDTLERPVLVVAALRSVLTSRSIFYPHDGDSLAPNTSLQFTLARPMTVTWTIRDSAGTPVVTRMAAVDLPAGTHGWWFNGRRADGTLLPRGRYTSNVVATDGVLTANQAVAFEMDAFTMKVSDTTPRRGQSITVTVVSAETLSKAPRLHIYQPGIARWSVKMTKIATRTYRVTFRLKSYGGTGNVSLRVVGYDKYGRKQGTTRTFPLH
jgi:flagellar hook assembly protein FlgD